MKKFRKTKHHKLKFSPQAGCSKTALAKYYFPASSPHVAVNHLMAWVNRCVPLSAALRETGYSKLAKSFTPRQIALIVQHLGEP